jgi:two-component system NtrC family sensor kinase
MRLRLPDLHLTFRTKVLVPVVLIMVGLVAATILTVNARLTKSFRTEAVEKLMAADLVFRNSQQIRARNLLLRYRNVPKDSRYKAVCQKADPRTLRVALSEMLEELGGDSVIYTSSDDEVRARATQDPRLNAAALEGESALSIRQAFSGQANVDTVLASSRLFDIVSIPVSVGESILGVLTFGDELSQSVAAEFKQLTHAEVVFFSENQVLASTMHAAHLSPAVLKANAPDDATSSQSFKEIQIEDETFFVLTRNFESLSGNSKLGYVLLSSYAQSLRALNTTQRMLALVGFIGTLLSTGVLWLIVRKVTQPLRELRHSAEAVGRGDFSRRVEVHSHDECGQLARVFNEMTEKIQNSRQQLEQTVETLRRTQAQLVQSEKLSAVGEFVSGVAHELNNPLTSVIGFAELLKQAEVSSPHRRHVELIVASANRCHKIVQSLLKFARQHKPERKPVKIEELIEATIEILRYQMRTSNIEVATDYEADLPRVMGDGNQLQQVFLNLINNARQAIEDFRPQGRIQIRVARFGQWVRLLFQDDGPGISEQNLGKIFNPFFTTKEVGKGTGLGLSLSYGIIKEHNGTITVQSSPGQGATFIVDLPIALENAAETRSSHTKRFVSAKFNGKGRKVLVIDDEEIILNLIGELLSSTGCELDLAQDGDTALKRISDTTYDAILCDWRMPGLSGHQVYDRVLSRNPDSASRFIFMTGDVMNETTQRFLKETGNLCLAKPFSLDELRNAVFEVFEKTQTSDAA